MKKKKNKPKVYKDNKGEYIKQWYFLRGKQKFMKIYVVDGIPADEFYERNADPITYYKMDTMSCYMNKGTDCTVPIRNSILKLMSMLFLLFGCVNNNNYGLYTAFVSYCNPTINHGDIELRLVADTDYGAPLYFEKMDVFTKPPFGTDSTIICQYSTKALDEIIGKPSLLMFKYRMSDWVVIDSQYISEEKIISKHLFIGRKSFNLSDSTAKYHFIEYHFNEITDTIFYF
jgi:hypothetical protein